MSKKNKKLKTNSTPTPEEPATTPMEEEKPEATPTEEIPGIIDFDEEFRILGPDDPHPKFGPWKSHTICVQESTLARLNAFAEAHSEFTRKVLTDAVIIHGLERYGY